MSKVIVNSDGLLANTHILVGGKELRATSIKIEIDNQDNMQAKLTIETFADMVDVAALEENTEIVLTERLPHE